MWSSRFSWICQLQGKVHATLRQIVDYVSVLLEWLDWAFQYFFPLFFFLEAGWVMMQQIEQRFDECIDRICPADFSLREGLSVLLRVWSNDVFRQWAPTRLFISQAGTHCHSTLQGHSKMPLVGLSCKTCLSMRVLELCVRKPLSKIAFDLTYLSGV